jgi:hypothetical protein
MTRDFWLSGGASSRSAGASAWHGFRSSGLAPHNAGLTPPHEGQPVLRYRWMRYYIAESHAPARLLPRADGDRATATC